MPSASASRPRPSRVSPAASATSVPVSSARVPVAGHPAGEQQHAHRVSPARGHDTARSGTGHPRRERVTLARRRARPPCARRSTSPAHGPPGWQVKHHAQRQPSRRTPTTDHVGHLRPRVPRWQDSDHVALHFRRERALHVRSTGRFEVLAELLATVNGQYVRRSITAPTATVTVCGASQRVGISHVCRRRRCASPAARSRSQLREVAPAHLPV